MPYARCLCTSIRWNPCRRALATLLVLVQTVACGHPGSLSSRESAAQPNQCSSAATCTDSVQVTYLGVGGFLLRHGSQALLTAPSFTHPRLLSVISGWTVKPDTMLVSRKLKEAGGVADVSAILVGHAHYDHLLDVPFVARFASPDVHIYGSPTMKHVLAGDAWLREGGRLVALDSTDVGDARRPGTWTYVRGGAFRFMALHSSHAPNWLGITIATGTVNRDYDRLPRTAWGYKMGEPYAYVIDVLAPDSTPVFRVFYQDAAARPQFNELPPLDGRDRRRVDLAIVCGANFDGAGDYPATLLRTMAPRYVLVGHWENFFRSPIDSLEPVPFLDAEELAKRLDAGALGRWTAPRPMSRLVFAF